MKQNINIEAEGNELILKNKAGDYVVIPKKYRLEVQDMIKDGCHGCIDALVETLPVMEDYAGDGSVYPPNKKVKVNQDNQIKEYDISSPEYKDLYNSGKLTTYDKNTDSYIATPLEEVTITAEAPQWLKYKREYEKNNPKSDYINQYLNPFARSLGNTETNYPKRLDDEYEQKALDYVSEQLVKNKPQGKLSRVEWLNQMSDKEEEIIKRNPKYQSSLWADTKRGLTSLVEQNPLQTFQNILNSSDYTNREKQEMLKDYANHPVMSKLGDAAKILNPLIIPSKMVQSAYKDDYSFSDALKGKKNNAGIVEDIVTDPLNFVGVGLAGKLSKADKVIDATKAGSNMVGKTDDVIKLVSRENVFDNETLKKMDDLKKYYSGDKTTNVSLLDKIKIGRDWATKKELGKAYRNTYIDEIISAKKQGYYNNNKFPDTDWYYGGSSGKYGNIEIEAIPDEKYFRLFKVDGKYAGINVGDKDILHLKGRNVPFENTIIRYKGKILSNDIIEEISKKYKKGDNLDELISSITK